ncbi:uncharacterized protein LOC108904417 [Anoplophora glabripennis]|uniref:uncharacterized protein LOC108904417 n=1 Tax=Anoplophora glabripennis TaxID=217634 RepID=UPI000874FB65|nr:uncharacterized protein LOC108904417 [Anoplophora glabripennis]
MLVSYIQNLEKIGYAPTSKDVRHMAFTFAEKKNGLKCRFKKDVQLAGYDWFKLFLRRHPTLSMRVAQGRSIARSLGMSHNEVDPYFKLLGETLEKHNLLDKPGKIFNMDETGLQLCNKPDKVVATKGSKDVQSVTSAEKGETISIIACCNAEGNYLPPYVIFKGKNKKKEFEDNMPPGSTVVISPDSAYVKSSIFASWIKRHFLPRKGPGPVVLVLDGHASHCSDVDMLDFLAENDIHVLCLPSHTKHWLQPLDRSFFKPLKTYWNSACGQWIRNHPGRRITRYQFGELLNQAWKQAATNQNAVSGFEACGIFPLNPDKIPDYAYVLSEQSDQHAETLVHIVAENSEDPVEPEDENTDLNRTISFEDIVPLPSISSPSRPRPRKQHAELLTSPQFRERKC